MNRFQQIGIILAAVVIGQVPQVVAASEVTPARQLQVDQAALGAVEDQAKPIANRITDAQSTLQLATSKIAEANQQVTALTTASQRLAPELQANTAAYVLKLAALKEAVSIDYQEDQPNGIALLVRPGSVSQALARATYLGAVQDKVDGLATDAQGAYDDLHDRTSELDEKRARLEILQRQLSSLQQTIVQQQVELLELQANKANEAVYLADKIKRAQAAQAALLQADGSGNALSATYTDGAKVRQGDIIGLEGSTGFSTGCHTHFSVIETGQWVDPQALLQTGILRRPDGQLTQPYGMTDWARTGAYGGGIHNGLDMVQGCGSSVKAASDGVVIRDNRTDGSGFGHYIMIRHTNGLITLYGHLI